MSTLIVLSSSPPQVFARSPTPVGSSSPTLPSTSAIMKGNSPGRKKFKTVSTLRDGCGPGFSTARRVLAEKGGAENVPIASPLRYKFRTSPKQCERVGVFDNVKTKQPTLPKPISKVARTTQPKTVEKDVELQIGAGSQVTEGPIIIQIARKDVRRAKKRAQSPLLLQKAVTRRTDWTPPKPTALIPDLDPDNETRTFPSNLLGSFGFAVPENDTVDYEIVPDNPTKRRRLEDTDLINSTESNAGAVPQLPQAIITKPTTKRSRSPAKKPLTITALATSKFIDRNEPEPTALLQYLTGSQALLGGSQDAGVLDEKVTKTKAALKKIRDGKKGCKKSLLVSPSSALRSFEEQEAIFGSASQLARDESPTLLKDTIEAIKLSESSFSHDLSSPLRSTQATSIGLTPQTGTSRFKRSRNLWAAAGRDDDNTLLHIDTVDLTDTPAIRNAFAGKDVLVQPSFSRSASPARKSPIMCGGYPPLARSGCGPFMDIDDIVSPVTTPALQQMRALHTSAQSTSPAKPQAEACNVGDISEIQINSAIMTVPKPVKSRKRVPKKPNYAGFTDPELKKQISAYGFKAVKKRDKMVELLERCWEEKHGTGTEASVEHQTETEAKVPGYCDILSNVHDVSARPVPKVIKPKASRKKKETDGTEPPTKKPHAPRKKKEDVLDENGLPVKKPRAPRKKKAVDETVAIRATTGKPVGKRKPKTNISPDEDGSPQGGVEKTTEETQKHAAQGPSESNPLVDEMATDSPVSVTPSVEVTSYVDQTLGTEEKSTSEPVTAKTTHSKPSVKATTLAPSSSLSDIPDQITKAVRHQSAKSSAHSNPPRNHQKNPTWHEKILMYDPIILEDLATWLNTEGLGAIGDDREISALDVRTWCESRGICCLWKGGWKGNKGKED